MKYVYSLEPIKGTMACERCKKNINWEYGPSGSKHIKTPYKDSLIIYCGDCGAVQSESILIKGVNDIELEE